MIQEDKSLLLKDLCARLPYGVKCNAFLKEIDGSLKSILEHLKDTMVGPLLEII